MFENASGARGLDAAPTPRLRALGGLPPEAVAEANLWFLNETGVDEHLSPNRSNGLDAMIRQIREAAA